MGRFLRRSGARGAGHMPDAGQTPDPPSAGSWRRRLVIAGAIAAAAVLVLALIAVFATAEGGSRSEHAAASLTPAAQVSPAVTASRQPSGPSRLTTQAVTLRQIIIPDLLVVAPGGLTASEVSGLRSIDGVRDMITFNGAQITVGDAPVNVIGVSPESFRPWVPLQTASDQTFWDDLSRGDFVAATTSAQSLRLHPGGAYELDGANTEVATYGMSGDLGVAGVDVLVNSATSARLGLVRQVAALISAPADSITTLRSKVAAVLGPTGKIEILRSQPAPAPSASADSVSSSAQPDSYLQLFQDSAAQYCPGLSWTVLAAIGQIESADGQNDGPSTVGALGPMQFLPSTWQEWGIDGFGETGTPDVMNPYDAVPSAARMLCADGASSGAAGLRQALYDYNHADWYVSEVLGLAAQYAADYS